MSHSGIVPNPLISLNKPTFSNGSAATTVTDCNYTTSMRYEPTPDDPFYIAINIGETEATRVLFMWKDQFTWNYWTANGGTPGDYTIQISNNSTDGTDGDWDTVVTVTDIIVPARSHVFNFGGYSWIKMVITKRAENNSGNVRIAIINIHDISEGIADHWLFLGDSFTAHAFELDKKASVDSFYSTMVAADAPDYFPAMIGAGHGGFTSRSALDSMDTMLELNPHIKYYAIVLGANDALSTSGAEKFIENMQAIIDKIKAAGAIPIIARTTYVDPEKNPSANDIEEFALACDQLTSQNNLIPGPDFYTHYKEHLDELLDDGLHPDSVGELSFHRLWKEAMIDAGLYDSLSAINGRGIFHPKKSFNQGLDLTTVTSGQVTIDIFTLKGQLVISHSQCVYAGQKLYFNSMFKASMWVEGVYILRIKGAGIALQRRILR